MITQAYFTPAILMMAVITFYVRYAFFIKIIDIKLTPQIKDLLTFTAPCILTAMFIPIMFQDMLPQKIDSGSIQQVSHLFHSSYFWASVVAILLSLFIRQTLLVILLSMAVFYGLRLWIFV